MYKRVIAMVLAIIMMMPTLAIYGEISPEIPVPELRGIGVGDENATEVNAYSKGYAAYVNAYFLDAQKTTYTRDIGRMAALGIIKKNGSMNYNADTPITKQDLVEALVRMSGREAQVMQGVLAQSAGMGEAAVANLVRQAYVTDATNQNIITQAESIGLSQPVNKETAAVWIARMLNLQPTLANADNVYSFGDWSTITPSNRGLIETLVSDKVMSVDNDGNFNPNRTISRGEVAFILNSTLEKMFAPLGITSNVGLIIGEKASDTQETGNLVKERRLLVRNMNGTLTTIVTKENTANNARNDVVTLKNDIVSTSKELKTGDQIEYLTRNNEVIFAEVYTDGSIAEQIKRQNDNGDNTNIYYGYISKKINEQKTENGNVYDVDRLRTTIYNGLVFDLVVEDNLTTGIRNDIIVYKDGKIGGVDLLKEKDVVEMLVKDEKNIVYVRVTEPSQAVVKGTLRFIESNDKTGTSMITVFTYDDKIKKYEATNYASVVINHEIKDIKDLKYGQDIVLDITNGYVTKISGETFIKPGHIDEYSKMRMGTVTRIDNLGNLKVKFSDNTYQTYKVPDGTPILKGGNNISSAAIREGDSVKLYFSDIYTNTAAKVEIEGKETMIKSIYRGLISDVNIYRKEITIVEPTVLSNAQWKNIDNTYSKTFTINEDADIYVRGKETPLAELDTIYKNKTVYLAIRDDYSKEQAMQISVAVGGEYFATDRIEDIDKVIGNLELFDNNRNVVFNEGTMIIKNSKLVDATALDERDDVLVVSDYYRGQNNANVIRITSDAEKIFDNIYIGAVEKVYSGTFTLQNYASISGNEWDAVKQTESAPFAYFNDLTIKNITDKKAHKTLTANQFFHGGYSKSENAVSNPGALNYRRYYTFFVTNEERHVKGMNIRHMGLLDGQNLDNTLKTEADIQKELDKRLANLRLSRGVVAGFNDTFKRIEITDSHDWAEDFGRWNANKGNTSVEYRDTIIMRDGQRIEREDVKLGDYLYILRDDEDALVIFVEDN